MSLWTASEIAAATGGQAIGDWAVTGVSIDSRSLRPGDLFVALTDIRDGHDFVAQALDKGAGAALVSRRPEGVAEDAPLIIVEDVLSALEALGRAGRARMQGKVVAITGSVGKTSTKDMLHDLLAKQGRVHAAEASYNNHWGVPLTLARMPADSDFAVIEIGMNAPGEIAPLARLARPDAAMITTIAPAHIGAFDDIEGIAREKAAIFDGLVPGGVAVIPTGLSTSHLLADGAQAAGARLMTFGPEGVARLLSVAPEGDGLAVKGLLNGAPVAFHLDTAGQHFAMNAMGVLALIGVIGGDLAATQRDFADWHPPKGRGAVENIGAIKLIDDAYNANPTSLAAGLATLAALPGQRRVAVLGDMLELGEDAAEQHAAMASDPAMAPVDLVHCAGPLMQALHQALPVEKRGEWAPRAADLAERLDSLFAPGDTVLIKGSKGSQIARVVDALRATRHQDA